MKSKMSRYPARACAAALAVAGLALSLSMGGANANTVTIQLQEDGVNGGAITTVATGEGSASITNLAYGTFTSVSVTGVGYPDFGNGQSALFSDLVGVSSNTAGTLTVYVSLDGAQLPVRPIHGGIPPVIIGLTVNTLPIGNFVSLGWTVQEDAYMAGLPFIECGGICQLASATFNSIGTNQTILPPNQLTSRWSSRSLSS
jgi:hypothetical protein